MRTGLAAALTVVSTIGCGSGEPKPPKAHSKVEPTSKVSDAAAKPVPTVEDQSKAIVLDGETLLLLSNDGKREVVAKLPGAAQCDAEPGGLVWVLGSSLWAFEPDTGKVVEVGTKTSGSYNWGVSYDDSIGIPIKSAGSYDTDSDCTALILQVSDSPTLGGQVFTDNDATCEEADTKAALAEFNQARLSRSDYAARLASSRKSWAIKAPPAPTRAPAVEVDLPNCKRSDPPCGTATHLGGSLWRINTGTTSGDAIHNHYQLYDSSSKEFWDPKSDTRSKTHFPAKQDLANDPDGGVEGLSVAPRKDWAIFQGTRLSVSPPAVRGEVGGALCGWR